MNEKPTHLDLFSGIGGFALAARWAGFRTIGFCEIDKYCQRVLAKNFAAEIVGNAGIASAPIHSDKERGFPLSEFSQPSRIFPDISDLDGTQFRRNGCNVTLLTGGFPCQPFSCAGKRRGKEDDRHLWPEMLRVIKEARPAWVLGENVAGIIGMELDTVLSDLETIGYACQPFVIPACGVDARHRRNRVWIVAHGNGSGSQGRNGEELCERSAQWIAGPGDSPLADAQHAERWSEYEINSGSHWRNGSGGRGEDVADAGRNGGRQNIEGRGSEGRAAPEWSGESLGTSSEWQPEPDVGRVADGIPARVDRLKGLGNAIVPQVAYQIMRAIREEIGAGTNTANK